MVPHHRIRPDSRALRGRVDTQGRAGPELSGFNTPRALHNREALFPDETRGLVSRMLLRVGRAPHPWLLRVGFARVARAVHAQCTFCADLDLPPTPWVDTQLEDQDGVGSMELAVGGGGENVCCAEMRICRRRDGGVVRGIGRGVPALPLTPFLIPPSPRSHIPADDDALFGPPRRPLRMRCAPPSSPGCCVLRGALYIIEIQSVRCNYCSFV